MRLKTFTAPKVVYNVGGQYFIKSFPKLIFLKRTSAGRYNAGINDGKILYKRVTAGEINYWN